ncbi:phosphonate metabolism transcriptional regulator PhnF [Desulfoscipio sp. XC116]|uniref:phosphonate metabolism transcriptional regulator PhnF n=1 Tax=Desulfoscipio sp. XC116 TaxID=3144975 RepID=UPI00325C04E4
MIDKESGIPYYRQLMAIIRRQVDNGVYKEGQRIPCEFELSNAYQVNRHTVRQAVAELSHAGILYKVKGRGTFVAKPPLDHLEYKISPRNRFTDNILQAGKMPGSRILRATRAAADEKTARTLGLSAGDAVYVLDILRLVDGSPFLLAVNFLPAACLPGFLERIENFSSLFIILEKHYGIRPYRVKYDFHASFPNREEALALKIPANMPVLKGRSLLKSQDGVLILYNVACYRGDQARVSIEW